MYIILVSFLVLSASTVTTKLHLLLLLLLLAQSLTTRTVILSEKIPLLLLRPSDRSREVEIAEPPSVQRLNASR